jgi:hypothetical protein
MKKNETIIKMHINGEYIERIAVRMKTSPEYIKQVLKAAGYLKRQSKETKSDMYVKPKLRIGEKIDLVITTMDGTVNDKCRTVTGRVVELYPHHAVFNVRGSTKLESFQYWDIWKYRRQKK